MQSDSIIIVSDSTKHFRYGILDDSKMPFSNVSALNLKKFTLSVVKLTFNLSLNTYIWNYLSTYCFFY